MYVWLSTAAVTILAIVGLFVFTHFGSYLKTGWLILQVSPYEQTGSSSMTVLIIGDSTGYGTGARTAAASVAGRIGTTYPDVRIENNSRNGRTVAAAQAVANGLSKDYNLIVLQIGANDILAGARASVVATKVRELAESALTHASAVVVMTAGNVGGSPRFSGTEAEEYQAVSKAYDRLMRDYADANKNNIWFVSLYDEPAVDPFVQSPATYMAADGLHPSGAGYAVWYEKAAPSIAEALRR